MLEGSYAKQKCEVTTAANRVLLFKNLLTFLDIERQRAKEAVGLHRRGEWGAGQTAWMDVGPDCWIRLDKQDIVDHLNEEREALDDEVNLLYDQRKVAIRELLKLEPSEEFLAKGRLDFLLATNETRTGPKKLKLKRGFLGT